MRNILICSILASLFLLSVSSASTSNKVPATNYPIITGDEEVIVPVAYPPYPPVIDLDNRDIVGDTVVIGTTWYESQSNGTVGRMLEKDEFGYLHFAWMNGLNSGASNRHIYYNFIDPSGSQGWPGVGCQVDDANRAGYVSLDLANNGIPLPTFHQRHNTLDYFYPAVGCDSSSYGGNFLVYEAPEAPSIAEILWPKIQTDRNGFLHLVCVDDPSNGD